MPLKPDDPCACGSGKKYKDCCLQKDEMENYRREQFYVGKQRLVEKIGYFLESKLFYQDVMQLKNEFKTRTKGLIEEDMQDSFMVFWFFFYHIFENGLRGIDWFNHERRENLTDSESEMLDIWRALSPRFLQMVDLKNDVAIFEDMDTKEQFPVSTHPENLGHPVPWISTFAMIEPFDDLYYFNGFYIGVGPKQLWHARSFVTQKQNETDMPRAEIFRQFFLEITGDLIDQDWEVKLNGIEVTRYRSKYMIQDLANLKTYLRADYGFYESEKDIFQWLDHFKIYEDSAFDQKVKIADELGTLKIEANRALHFETLDADAAKAWQGFIEENKLALECYDTSETQLGLASKPQHHVKAFLEETSPLEKYASFFDDWEIDSPLAIFEGRSVLEVQADFENGKNAVEMWLRDEEYTMYRRVLGTEGKVEVTADFNRLRKKLHHELSPFVTQGKARQSHFEKL